MVQSGAKRKRVCKAKGNLYCTVLKPNVLNGKTIKKGLALTLPIFFSSKFTSHSHCFLFYFIFFNLRKFTTVLNLSTLIIHLFQCFKIKPHSGVQSQIARKRTARYKPKKCNVLKTKTMYLNFPKERPPTFWGN